MRMMVTIRPTVAAGSRAIVDGSMGRIIEQIIGSIKPESAYFYLENGRRTMRAVYDLKQPGDIVAAFEPAMIGMEADVEITPVMTGAELAAAIAASKITTT